jgi:uncharacterized membrane protein
MRAVTNSSLLTLPSSYAPVRQRIESVDIVRGIIMILMALDHTRDYFGSLAVSPTDLATTTPWLFMTRWITHICAPVFFLLTGTGSRLALRRREAATDRCLVKLSVEIEKGATTDGRKGTILPAQFEFHALVQTNAILQ